MTRQGKLLIALGAVAALYLFTRTKTGSNMLAQAADKIAALIFKEEGLRLTVYQDTGGAWTIGYGHKVLPGEGFYPYGSTRTITKEQALALREKDTRLAASAVTDYVNVPLTVNQLTALVSLAYNIGRSAFGTSTLARLLNNRDYAGAASQFDRWVYDNGKVDPILVARRAREKKLFLTPDSGAA